MQRDKLVRLCELFERLESHFRGRDLCWTAYYLHHSYCCFESMVEEILGKREIRDLVKEGSGQYHKRLLDRFFMKYMRGKEYESIRNTIDEWMKFRHRFRRLWHGELEWEELEGLARAIVRSCGTISGMLYSFAEGGFSE